MFQMNAISSDPSHRVLNNRQKLIHRAKMKSLRISVAIVAAFIICWTPYYVSMLMFMFMNPDKRVNFICFIRTNRTLLGLLGLMMMCWAARVYNFEAMSSCDADCSIQTESTHSTFTNPKLIDAPKHSELPNCNQFSFRRDRNSIIRVCVRP